jgi:tryptophan-rich sensory protein
MELDLTAVLPPRRAAPLAAAAFGAAVTAAALAGGAATRRSARSRWYAALRKPPGQPPPAVFGPVWTALYAAMATSGYRVWRTSSPGRSRALRLWAAQLALNAAWSPLFFGARRPRAALADVALLLPTVGAYALAARKVDRAAAWLVVPYLAWTGFALWLNAGLVVKNRRRLARSSQRWLAV